MTKSKYQNKSQFQNPKLKFGFGILKLFGSISSIWILGFILFWAFNFDTCHLHAFAQDNSKLVSLSKQIIEVKTIEDAYPLLHKLTELYLKEHKYNECVDYLKSLINRKRTLEPLINYYIGFTRYSQLRYLEETQSWDEYFNQGNSYRDEIVGSLGKTIAASNAPDAVGVYARLILWKFHKDQNDTLNDAALSNLMNFILSYAKETKNLIAIKEVAVELSAYGEKAKANSLYKVYVDKIVACGIKDEELKTEALDFYNEGNLDLAEGIYDVYIERIEGSLTKEKNIPLLIEIAKIFVYRDQGLNDALYAEKVLQKIEELGTKDVFDEELIYLRAFNLEKVKEYQKAKDLYLDLAQRYPQGTHADEAYFKAGIIYTYILGDPKMGDGYFEKLVRSIALSTNTEPVEGLAKEETPSPQAISSLYQLGLLRQWEDNLVLAKEYYNKLLGKARDGFAETVSLTKERLKEIEEARPIEYNLKTFLDASLRQDYAHLDMSKLNLKLHPYRGKKKEAININASIYTAASGCLEVNLQYLWSGHLGQTGSLSHGSSFNTTYNQGGTKEINLVVVSPAGIIDRSIDLLDVEESP